MTQEKNPVSLQFRETEVGLERRCRVCCEWWPADNEFYDILPNGRYRRTMCRACRYDTEHSRPIPKRATSHSTSGIDWETKRAKDRERKRQLRLDPVMGDKLRARQREAQRRFYERNRAAVLARHREAYAARIGRQPTPGVGRPRLEDAA